MQPKAKKSKEFRLKTLTFIGLICLVVPVVIYSIWIYSANLDTSQSESVEIFHSYFPPYLRGRFTATYISILFLIPALISSAYAKNLSDKVWKIINYLILIVSGGLLFLNLFSLL